MASRLTTEILINLAGNLTAKARQYGANMSEFARRNERAMSVVKSTSAAAGRALDSLGNRYTGMIAGFATGATVKGVADFDAQMRRMGTDAQLTREQVISLHEQIRDISNQGDIRLDASALGQGVSELLGKTGDYKFVADNLRNMGLLMQAFGVDGQTAAGLLAQFWEKGVKGSGDVSKMLDKLYAQFAVGSVSVADIARVAPKLFSIIQQQGPVAIAQMGAFAQVFAKNKGSADETVTSIQAMYAALSNKKNIDFLKANGIDVFQKGTKELKLPFELMKEILARAKNDPVKLQDVFDQTGMQGITTLLKPENIRLMQELIYGTVEYGSTQNAAKTNAEGFNSAMQSLNNEWQRFAESNLAQPVQELADALNSVDHETVQNWLNIGKNITIAVGGLIAARKVFKVGKGAWDLFGGGKSKGIPKNVSDAFGSGVMPVYVVNMSGGFSNGGPGSQNGPTPATGPKGAEPTKPVPSGSSPSSPKLPELPTTGMTRWTGLALGAMTGVGMTYLQSEAADYIAQNIYEGSGLGEKARQSPTRDWSYRVASELQLDTPAQEKQKRSDVWDALVNFFTTAVSDTSSMPQDPRPWASMQNQSPNYPLVPPQLQGEIRVVVEGDARVKSVKMDQPGVKLSASAGISSVEQN
ncbi:MULTISPECIES: phage tail tape measure protein [Mangrovibacter]|uniref:phage tail tape measure protein n=1 Tax=Mangrovibacter TaxID=451512 RepID=UPI0004D7EFA3|nr:phage tail tape measure protein [Mangrovibacter sp. MFB070]KEA51791.1 tail protein [Mangrovibacter sp. MFB070]